MNDHRDLPIITSWAHGFIHFDNDIIISASAVEECFNVKISDFVAAHPYSKYEPIDSLKFYNEAIHEIYLDTVTKQKNELDVIEHHH